MNNDRKLQKLLDLGAVQKGHFLLASGLHSDYYVQCARIFEYPKMGEEIAKEVLQQVDFPRQSQTVASIAMGAVLWGYDLSKILQCRNIFAERRNNILILKRGFDVQKGEKILIAEDVITSGGSTMELAQLLIEKGAVVAGVIAIINRSTGRFNPDFPYQAWLNVEFPTYDPINCPLCKNQIPITTPGTKQSANL